MDNSPEISIPGVGKDVFGEIVAFAYTGKVTISTENVQDLLVAANYYQCEGIVDATAKFMVDFLDETNVLDAWELANSLSLSFLCEKCQELVMTNLETILKDEDCKRRLFQCPPEIFEKILKSDDLVLRCPVTCLPTYANVREKAVIGLIKAYCSVGNDRAGIAPRLLRRCVKWLLLACEENCFNICDQFDTDSSEVVREMLGAAIGCMEGIREAFSAGKNHPEKSRIINSIF